jgi:lysophospholipase L1-like esterase/uncharacterized damage-inducible protein DinB
MPAVNVGLLEGQLAWRQHDGGHTDGPNWKYFIPWADKFIGHTPPGVRAPADRPTPRTDENSMLAHTELLEKARKGRIDVYFVGDSITRRWGALDYPELLAHWTSNFFGWNAANFGWGADKIQNILWRLENGELDGVNPKVIVVLAGTNNVGSEPGGDEKIADITRGLRAILDGCRRKAPDATIVLTAIFPRNDNISVMPEIERINSELARLADGRKVRYLNVNNALADKDGRLRDGMMNDADKLHPTIKGYQVWADGLKPILFELLGPPAATDHAPPPTGNPAAPRSSFRQDRRAADTANPVSRAIKNSWNNAKRNITESADQMPEGDYAFRPVDTVRTFGQIVAHVAGASYVYCSAARAEKSPFSEGDFEKTATTKAAIIKALADSNAYCDAAFDALTDASAGELVSNPFGQGQFPRATALLNNINHLNEHYGNLVTYFRIKGMVPPSSRR